MRKRATGLTSIPIPDIPGSENVEVKDIEPEDAEAANHGGFNQMEPGNFAKDLETVKRMMRLKKKASFNKKADFFADKANKMALDDIIEDFAAGADGFDADNTDDYKVNRPDFIKNKKFDPSFDPDLWIKTEFRNIAKSADFESGPGRTTHSATVPPIIKAWYDLYSAGSASPDQYETAMQNVFSYTLNLDDDMFNGLSVMANAMVAYKELKAKYEGTSETQTSKSPAEESKETTEVAAENASGLKYSSGTELKDIAGDYSYKIISPSEIEIIRADGSTVTVTPDTASENNVNWDLMVSILNDSSQTEVVKSANNIFNITKVSKDMKNELRKLNSALNGLGYRDLIKIASTTTYEPGTNDGLLKDKIYIFQDGSFAVRCLNIYIDDYIDTEAKVKIIWVKDTTQSLSIPNAVKYNASVYPKLGGSFDLADDETEKFWTETDINNLKLLGGTFAPGESGTPTGGTPTGGTPTGGTPTGGTPTGGTPTGGASYPRAIRALTPEQLFAQSEIGNLYYYSGQDANLLAQNYWIGFPDRNTVSLSSDGKEVRYTSDKNSQDYTELVQFFKARNTEFTKSSKYKAK